MKESKVKIVFKSGHVEIFKVKEFKVTKRGDVPVALQWSPDIEPKILQIDLDEIATVLEIPG